MVGELLACLLACLFACLVGWLVGWLVAWLLGWLAGLARSDVFDFWLLLSEFYRKTALTCSKSEVEHDFSKTHVPAVILKFVCRRPNFTRFLNP